MKKSDKKWQEDIARVFQLQEEFEQWRKVFVNYSSQETLGIKLHAMSDEELHRRFKDAEKLWTILEGLSHRLRQQIHDGQATFPAEFTTFLADMIAYLPTLALEQQALERTLQNRRLYGHTQWLEDHAPSDKR